MHLHVWFIQRKERFPGQYGPEARLVVDEFTMDENPTGFQEQVDQERKTLASEIAGDAVVTFDVDMRSIRNRCLQVGNVLRAGIVPESPKA